MIYMLDTANIEEIKKGFDLYPLMGVTTNPSIIAKENRNFYDILGEIREAIGEDAMLHVQALGRDAETIVKEALNLREKVNGNLYIKIPAMPQGIKAMKILREMGIKITATAILTPQQALMAARSGAEYLAPYVNRADNICGEGTKLVEDIVKLLEVSGNTKAKVLGASFKNVNQVHNTILAGAKSVTVNMETMDRLLYHPLSDWSVDTFVSDWEKIYGKGKTTIDVE